jgi:hypothetical protein
MVRRSSANGAPMFSRVGPAIMPLHKGTFGLTHPLISGYANQRRLYCG